ncbi:MAG: type IV pilus modification PilV family protein [Thermodesulfobacteriota bacterium]
MNPCFARTGAFRNIKKPGFTLMEVLIAMAVLAIALTGFFSLFSQTVAVEEVARFNTVAPMLAQKIMAEAVAGRAGTGGDFPDHPGYAWGLSISDVAPGALGGDAVEGLKQMDVKVTLNNGERAYSLRAYDWLASR